TGTKESGRSAEFSTADSQASRESADGRSRFAAIDLSLAPLRHMLFSFRHGSRAPLVPLEGGRTWLIVRGRAYPLARFVGGIGDTTMNDVRIARITGAFGLACVALTFGQFPLWTIGSAP